MASRRDDISFSYFRTEKMSRTRKRATTPTTWDSYRISRPRTMTPARKPRNSRLLSGHTNTTNKTLSFVDTLTGMNTAVGSLAHKVYRANSSYDPDYALGGQYAYGHQTMGDRFEKYYAKSARLSVLGSSYNVLSSPIQLYALVWADNTETFSSTTPLNTAMGICKANGGKVFRLTNTVPQGPGALGSVKVRTKDVYRNGIKDDKNIGGPTSNPENLLFFHVVVAQVSASVETTCSTELTVELSYEELWFDPVDRL